MSDLAIGNKVAVFPIITDGTCHWCEQESYGLCPNWGFLGYSGLGGGMAEYIVVERKAVHKVPDHVPLDVAALVEPLAVGWHAVRMAKPVPEDCCLVLGAGKCSPDCTPLVVWNCHIKAQSASRPSFIALTT